MLQPILVATGIGTLLQIGMVVTGHQLPAIKALFGPGGMLISLIAGALFARLAGAAWGQAIAGGAVAGGLCALIGIGVSVLLKDVPAWLLIFGTIGSAVAGLAGGALGRWLGGQ